MIRETSRRSYYQLLKEKKLNVRQAQVLIALRRRRKALSNRLVAEYTGLPINVVTPRMLELRGKKLVEEAYRELDEVTNRTVIHWRPVHKIRPIAGRTKRK